MERYDAAIIGAGPHGLIAAQILAREGLCVIVLERAAQTGGRAGTREFHPGFRASPFTDELPSIPGALFRELNLAGHGVLLMPAPASVCLSGDGVSILFADEARLTQGPGFSARTEIARLRREICALQAAMAARPVLPRQGHSWLALRHHRVRPKPWPGDGWSHFSLDNALRATAPDARLRLHLTADAVSGRAVSPFLAGTALHLLRGFGSGMPAGGLGALGAALDAGARAAGATIRCEAEVTDIAIVKRRAGMLVLAGGEEIGARAILSTLDVKRTFLGLCAWNALSADLVKRIARYRMMGQVARVLLALDAPPEFPFAREAPDSALGPVHVVASIEHLSQAHDACRAGILAEMPPVTLRVPSLSDPGLAPVGKAVMTVTIGAVPSRLFDGGWTDEQRKRLNNLALAAADQAAPGTSARVVASQIIVGPDIEEAIGVTDGDLDGGEVAPDQVFGLRPFAGWQDGRTAVAGLYLGGHSVTPSPFLLGSAAIRAARALFADLTSGRLK